MELNNNSKILKEISQNICKNKLLTDINLENDKNFNITFIQELPQSIICKILSFMSKKEENIIKASHYPSWIIFTRSSLTNNNYPKVITYINIKLIKLCF